MPVYEDSSELKSATDELSGYSPLVFAGEVRSLQESLAKASQGHGFLLMGGDCAEAFNEVREGEKSELPNVAPFMPLKRQPSDYSSLALLFRLPSSLT